MLTVSVLDLGVNPSMVPSAGGYLVFGNTIYVWYSEDYPKGEGLPVACFFPVRLTYEIEGLERSDYRVKLIDRETFLTAVFAVALGGALFVIATVLPAKINRWPNILIAFRRIGRPFALVVAGLGLLVVFVMAFL